MKLEKVANRWTWLLVGLLVAACASVWLAFTLAKERRMELVRLHEASDALNHARVTTYALSQHAKRYLSTTDVQHLQAYWNARSAAHVPGEMLQARMGDVISAADRELIQASAERTEELERLQLAAIAAARESRWGHGEQILTSVLYLNALEGVLEPLDAVEDSLHRRGDARIQALDARVNLTTVLAMVVLLGTALMVLLVLRFFYYRRVLRPLVSLTENTQRLLHGATDVRYGHLGEATEIGDLSRALSRYQSVMAQLDSKSRQLGAAEAWYRQIIEFAPDGMLVVDLEGNILIANPKAHQLFGYEPGSLIGVPVDTLAPERMHAIHAELRANFMAPDSQCPTGDLPGWALDRSGREFPIEMGLTHLPVLDGRAACVCVSVRDITERKRYEKAIAEQLELRRVLLDTLPHPVFFKDTQLRYVGCNQTFLDVFAVDRDYLVGKTALEFFRVPEADCARYQEANERVRTEGGSFIAEMSIPYADGVMRPVIYSLSSYSDSNGQVAGLVGTLVDISAQKAAELAQAQAKELAEEATRLKSDFLANMSHEIRTPMNVVLGMAHLALGTALDGRQRGYVEKIHTAAKGLLGIINDILDFSKVEAGKLHFEQVDFFLEDVLADALDMATLKAQEKNLELLYDIGTDVPNALVGDPLRLGQVLCNLLSNAVKFTSQGEVTVAVHREGDAEGMVWLRFEVRDSGIGLTDEQLGHLFQAFVQADSSMTRRYGGTGLGLAISRRIVELMGGEISVLSTPHVGSTFMFRVPLGLQGEQRPLRFIREDLQGQRILVVDDNASAREIFQSMLAAFHFEVTTAANARDALALLKRASADGQPFRLVIMDWIMPDMDGLQAIRIIRDDPALGETPSFMLATAYNRDELLERLGDLPIEGILVKPVTPSTLLDSLHRVFGGDASTRPLTRQINVDANEPCEALKGARLLLVEDNLMNQEVGVELLTRAGILVDVAGNGAEALEMVAKQRYDAVLMDCQMPVMDGFEAARRIRAQPAFAQMPILAMTANTMSGDRKKCLAAGMNDHIAKPVDVNQLFTTLQRWVRPGAEPASVAVVRADLANLPELAGLKLEVVLRRLGGDRALLRRLLSRFCESELDCVTRIRAALAAGEHEVATRTAHTLKGLAGNIGAEVVALIAGEVETQLRHGADAAEQDLADLDRELRGLIERIEESSPALIEPPANEMPPLAAQPQRSELRAALVQLRILLEEADGDAGAQLATLHAALAELGLARQADDLRRLISRYQFDAALEALVALVNDLNASAGSADVDSAAPPEECL